MIGGSSTCTTAPTPGTPWPRRSNTWHRGWAGNPNSRERRGHRGEAMVRVYSTMFCVFVSLCPLSLGGEKTSLESRLAPLATAHKGQVAIAVKHLDTGESF